MTIERKVKYVASDGTEHDSPQEAARHDLQNYLYGFIEQCWPGIPTKDLVEVTTGMARNPEALRDAVNAYFEALEEYPDVEHNPYRESCDGGHCAPAWIDPQCWHRKPQPLGNPNDPSTWRVEMPAGRTSVTVDHSNYCKQFGSNEEDV